MRPIPILLLGALVAGPAWSAPQEPTSRPVERSADEDLDARYQALVADFEEANEAFYEALMELPEDAGPDDFPTYPGEAFYPRFRELADSGHLDAMFWCLDNGSAGGPGQFVPVFRMVVEAAPGDERIGELLSWLHWSVSGPDAELLAALDAYIEVAPDDQLVFAARGAKGMVLTMDETDAEATAAGLAILEDVLKVKMDFPGRGGIEGQVFKLKHLGVGMVAPDWSATDVDGEPIALSDYRGKVTVLEFWGFW